MSFAPSPAVSPAPSGRGVIIAARSSVFLPKEHGSWSLALEPLALGLIVAPSIGGAALAVAVVAAFFARRPLKAMFVRSNPPRLGARWALTLLALCAAAGLAEAAILGGVAALWPLLLAVPFGGLFLFLDLRNESRAAFAELAGAAAFATLPAALASLGGWSPEAALGLAAVMAARAVPTVLVVRQAVRLGKHQATSRAVPVIAAVIAVALLATLAASSLVPWITAGFALLLLARTLGLVAPRRRTLSARQIGIAEAVLGVLYVTVAALGYRA